MNSIKYEPLFKLVLNHDFFTSGFCPGLEIVPRSSTQQVMQSFGMRLVARNGGYELFYQTDQNGSNPFTHSGISAFMLEFRIKVNDPLFYNYTDLPNNYLASNGLLSSWRTSGDQLKFSEYLHQIVPKLTITEAEEYENEYIEIDNEQHAMDLGLIQVSFDLDRAVADDWLDFDEVPVVNLQFISRKTKWRYLVIVDNVSNPILENSLSIINRENEMADEKLFEVLSDKTTLANGTEAIVLESKDLLALRERYVETYTLKFNHSVNGELRPGSIELPMAGTNNLESMTPGQPQEMSAEYYSNMYIYL